MVGLELWGLGCKAVRKGGRRKEGASLISDVGVSCGMVACATLENLSCSKNQRIEAEIK